MLNLKKLEKISYWAFDNALRLHFDAIYLFEDQRYPSAFYLSVLAQEELGKMYIIDDFVWHSRIEGRMPEFEEKWIQLIYKHPHKQGAFIRNSPLNTYSKKGFEIMEKVFKGTLEAKKQRSVYVGLGRKGRNIDTKGRVYHAGYIDKIATQKQITKINDHLLVTGLGVRAETYILDNPPVEYEIKNKKFLKDIHRNWPLMTREAKTRIRSLQKFMKEEIIVL